MIVKDFDNIYIKICKELLDCGYEEDPESKGRFVNKHKSILVDNHGDSVQIFSLHTHDWSSSVFPINSVMTICGNSIFYFGRLDDNE